MNAADRSSPVPPRTTRVERIFGLAAGVIVGLTACASDEPTPDTVPGDEPAFDVSVDPGVDTETDEGRNSGFDGDPSGNQTNVND